MFGTALTCEQIVNGELRGAKQSYHGINPATEEQLWPVPVATKDDLEDAVAAAKKAFKTWSQTPIEKRKEAMRNYAKALTDHQAELEAIVVKETGKPVRYFLASASFLV